MQRTERRRQGDGINPGERYHNVVTDFRRWEHDHQRFIFHSDERRRR